MLVHAGARINGIRVRESARVSWGGLDLTCQAGCGGWRGRRGGGFSYVPLIAITAGDRCT